MDRDGGCIVHRLLAGSCGGTLHVHHIQPVRERPDLADEPSNGVVVCARHHPTLESVRRILAKERRCPHEHRSAEARRLCERRLNRAA